MDDNARVRVSVNGVRLYFNVEGCGLAVRDAGMTAKPTLVLLHGGPGADHSLFKPEFSSMVGDDIGKVACPVLILAGEDDPAAPVAAVRRAVSSTRHPAVGLHVFAGVGHGVFRQAPSQAFAVLRRFLPQSPANVKAEPASLA